jgi:hypothetical protein
LTSINSCRVLGFLLLTVVAVITILSLCESRDGLGSMRVILRDVPRNQRGDVGGGDVSQLHTSQFDRDVTEDLVTGRTGEGDDLAAKVEAGRIDNVFAEDGVP